MVKSIRDILVSYAQSYGGGLPLTAEEICNATVLWVQKFVPENVANYSVGYLSDIIKGSDTIVVDESEDGQTLEVHLDYEVIQKLDRAILTPVVNPSIRSVPAVNPDGIVEYIPVTSLTTGVYNHLVTMVARDGSNDATFIFVVTSDDSTPYTSIVDFYERYFNRGYPSYYNIPVAFQNAARAGVVSLYMFFDSSNNKYLCNYVGVEVNRADSSNATIYSASSEIKTLTSVIL